MNTAKKTSIDGGIVDRSVNSLIATPLDQFLDVPINIILTIVSCLTRNAFDAISSK